MGLISVFRALHLFLHTIHTDGEPVRKGPAPPMVFLDQIKNRTAYGFKLAVGTPPQKVTVLVDTGSPTWSVVSPNANACQKGLCKDYGTFDNTSSLTCQYAGGSSNDLVTDFGGGSFLNDTVCLNKKTCVPEIEFGYITNYSAHYPMVTQQAAIMGLGAICDDKDCRSYGTYLEELYNNDVIQRRVISLYLGMNMPQSQGQLVFGGYDKLKFKKGFPILSISMEDPTTQERAGQPNWIKMTGQQLLRANGTNTMYHLPDSERVRLLDSGNPRWHMHEPAYRDLLEVFGLPRDFETDDRLVVDCKHYSNSKDKLVVEFGVFNITVPLHRLVTKLGHGKCVADVAPGDGALGVNFMRNVYTIFDYDNLMVNMTEAAYIRDRHLVKL